MLKVRVEVDMAKLYSKKDNALKAAQMQLDQDVLKDSNDYIPADEWNLKNSSIRASLIGLGRIIWDTPYAKRLYYNPQYNFSKDKNPNAQGLWFEAAKAERKEGWLESIREKYRQYFDGK